VEAKKKKEEKRAISNVAGLEKRTERPSFFYFDYRAIMTKGERKGRKGKELV